MINAADTKDNYACSNCIETPQHTSKPAQGGLMLAVGLHGHLGFGRIVVSDIKAPNMLANMVYSG